MLEESYVKDLLNVCLCKIDDFQSINPYLKTNFISDEDYRIIWRKIQVFHSTNKKLPTVPFLIQDFSDKNKSSKYDRVIDLLIDLKNSPCPDSQIVLRGFEDFIKRNNFVEFYDRLADLYNKEQHNKAFSEFVEKAKWFENFTLNKTDFIKVFSDWEDRNFKRTIDSYSNKQIQIPSGFDFLDESTEGGLWTGETELWLGDSGVGKTKFLTTRGINSAIRGFNVLHIQIEGTREQCELNYDANWTGFRYIDLKINNLNAKKISTRTSLAKKILSNHSGEIYIKTATSFKNKINFNEVSGWVKQLKKEGVTIHHLIVDYLELMSPNDNSKKWDYEGGERKILDEVARDFKDTCMEHNMLGTTVAQANSVDRIFLDNPSFVLSRYNIGKHKRLVESFSYFLTINQTKIEKSKQIARIFEDKLREHESGKTHKIKQSLKNSRFYDRLKTMEMLQEDEEYDD